MFKSDLILRSPWQGLLILVAALAWSGCSGGDETAEAPPQTPNITLNVEPLTDAELMGVPREQVLLTLPWSERVVSRDPAPNAARATLYSVNVQEGPGFDRTTFEFGTDTDFPGYRVVWDDSASARCADEEAAELGSGRTLLVRLEPAWTRGPGGENTIAQTSRSPRLPSVGTARQLCDEGGKVIWALAAGDSALFRVVEMHTPPRLVVDLAHPGATLGGTESVAVPEDSAAAAPR